MTYTPEQRNMIALARRLSRGYGPRVRQSLLEAMAVESNFRNLNYGDRDSQGVLQQRPSTGWGPPGNAAQDIRQYLERAGALVQRGFHGTPGQLAQAVQRSAFPGRYDQHAAEAASLLGGGAGPSGPAAGPAGALGPAATGGSPAGDPRAPLLQALIQASQGRDPGNQGVISALGLIRQGAQNPPSASSPLPSAGGGPSGGRGDIAELFYDPLGSIKNGRPGGAIGGHADHVHFSATSPGQMLAAIRQAQRMGLHVGENPYVGPVAPVHVEGSYHYRDFPGSYRGRKLGEAIDVSGAAALMARYFKWVRSHL